MVMERPPEWMPQWMVELRLRFNLAVKKLVASQVEPWNVDQQAPEQREKLELLYNEMIKDINEADVPENIKVGLDPLPAMIGFLLASAGGGAVAMILSSLLMPYIQSKLTYPMMKQAQPFRLPPDVVFRLWWKLHKGEGSPKELLDDLLEQGWSPERIEQGKEASKVMPTPQDIVNFLAHEVFEQDMIDKYKLDSEWDTIDKEWAKKIGLDEKILHLYWLNHWQHPSLQSVYQMLHREEIEPGDVDEYYKLVEIPEYWRDKLTELSWNVPNRIEIRMMARYLDLPKPQVMKLLQYAGLKEEFRSDAADFMIIMGLQGYWSTMFRNGWLSPEQLLKEIEAKEISPAIADKVYKYIVKAEKPERTAKERDLTKSEIYRGIKKNKINREFGAGLIEAMGYDEWEAKFLVDTNVPEDTEDKVVSARELSKTDIFKGLKTKELTEADAVTRLVALRYPASDANLLLRIYTAVIEKPTEERKRQESKADIITAVKKGIITNEDGYLRLMDIDFTPEASEFILSVRVEETPFSPQGPAEFLNLVNKYKRSIGVDVNDATEAALQAEKVLLEAEARLIHARETEAPQADILQLEALRDELKTRFEAALAQAQQT